MRISDLTTIKDIVIITVLGFAAYKVYSYFKKGVSKLDEALAHTTFVPEKTDSEYLDNGKRNKFYKGILPGEKVYEKINGLLYFPRYYLNSKEGYAEALPYEYQTEGGKKVLDAVVAKYNADTIDWNKPNAMSDYLKQTGWLK